MVSAVQNSKYVLQGIPTYVRAEVRFPIRFTRKTNDCRAVVTGANTASYRL